MPFFVEVVVFGKAWCVVGAGTACVLGILFVQFAKDLLKFFVDLCLCHLFSPKVFVHTLYQQNKQQSTATTKKVQQFFVFELLCATFGTFSLFVGCRACKICATSLF